MNNLNKKPKQALQGQQEHSKPRRKFNSSKPSRIQVNNRKKILEAALEVFSTYGFRGATLDQIAQEAKLSKPNLIYYYKSKEEIHAVLLENLLDLWLDPLRKLDENGDPVEELINYVLRKLEMSKKHPRESRLYANEIIQGAPHIDAFIGTELRELMTEKAKLIEGWCTSGKIAKVDPFHLILSIWATTQHYADFEAQISLLTGQKPIEARTYADAALYLEQLYRKLLAP